MVASLAFLTRKYKKAVKLIKIINIEEENLDIL